MGRALRIEYPNAFYHVMSHGNGLQWIYSNKAHLKLFKKVIKRVVKKYKFKIHAIVLMKNHYHILLETPLGNLSLGMKKFNQDFAHMFNKLKGRKGSVFRDRYKAILIDKETYYWNVVRYICQNPLRKKIVNNCEDYEGSFLYWLKQKNEITEYLFLDEIRDRFLLNKYWKKNFYKWINEKIEKEIKSDSKTKFLVGNTNWLKKISKRINKIEGEVKEKKKYYEIKIEKEYIEQFCQEYDDKTKIAIKIYVYSNYSSLTHKKIAEMLNIKSANSSRQRLYLFNKYLEKNPKIKEKIDLLFE